MTGETYRMPARSLGTGAILRLRAPAFGWVDFVIDRIELRPGDEVRVDVVDPATGWGAFLVWDGSHEVEVVIPTSSHVDAPAPPDTDPRELCYLLLADGGRCWMYADHEGAHRDAAGAAHRLADDNALRASVLDRRSEPDPMSNIGDTCCGACPGGTCYVDQITGA